MAFFKIYGNVSCIGAIQPLNAQSVGNTRLQRVHDSEIPVSCSIIIGCKLTTVGVKQICIRVAGIQIGLENPLCGFIGNDGIFDVSTFGNIVCNKLGIFDNVVNVLAAGEIIKSDCVIEIAICSVGNEGNADRIHIRGECSNAILFAKLLNRCLDIRNVYIETNVFVSYKMELFIRKPQEEYFFRYTVNLNRCVEINGNVGCEFNVGIHPITDNVCFSVAVLFGQIFHYDITGSTVDILQTAVHAVVETVGKHDPVVRDGRNFYFVIRCMAKNTVMRSNTVLCARGGLECVVSPSGVCVLFVLPVLAIRRGMHNRSLTTVLKVVGVVVLVPIISSGIVIIQNEIISCIVCIRLFVHVFVSIRVSILLETNISIFTKRSIIIGVGIFILIPILFTVGINILDETRLFIVAPTTIIVTHVFVGLLTVFGATIVKSIHVDFFTLNVFTILVVIVAIRIIASAIGALISVAIIERCVNIVVVGACSEGNRSLACPGVGYFVITELNRKILRSRAIIILQPILRITDRKFALYGVCYSTSINIRVRMERIPSISGFLTVIQCARYPDVRPFLVKVTFSIVNIPIDVITASTTFNNKVSTANRTVLGEINTLFFVLVVPSIFIGVTIGAVATFLSDKNAILAAGCSLFEGSCYLVIVVDLCSLVGNCFYKCITNIQRYLIVCGSLAVFGVVCVVISAIITNCTVTIACAGFHIPLDAVFIGIAVGWHVISAMLAELNVYRLFFSAGTSIHIKITTLSTIITEIVGFAICVVIILMILIDLTTIQTLAHYGNTGFTILVVFVIKDVGVYVIVACISGLLVSESSNNCAILFETRLVAVVDGAVLFCFVRVVNISQTAFGAISTLNTMQNAIIVYIRLVSAIRMSTVIYRNSALLTTGTFIIRHGAIAYAVLGQINMPGLLCGVIPVFFFPSFTTAATGCYNSNTIVAIFVLFIIELVGVFEIVIIAYNVFLSNSNNLFTIHFKTAGIIAIGNATYCCIIIFRGTNQAAGSTSGTHNGMLNTVTVYVSALREIVLSAMVCVSFALLATRTFGDLNITVARSILCQIDALSLEGFVIGEISLLGDTTLAALYCYRNTVFAVLIGFVFEDVGVFQIVVCFKMVTPFALSNALVTNIEVLPINFIDFTRIRFIKPVLFNLYKTALGASGFCSNNIAVIIQNIFLLKITADIVIIYVSKLLTNRATIPFQYAIASTVFAQINLYIFGTVMTVIGVELNSTANSAGINNFNTVVAGFTQQLVGSFLLVTVTVIFFVLFKNNSILTIDTNKHMGNAFTNGERFFPHIHQSTQTALGTLNFSNRMCKSIFPDDLFHGRRVVKINIASGGNCFYRYDLVAISATANCKSSTASTVFTQVNGVAEITVVIFVNLFVTCIAKNDLTIQDKGTRYIIRFCAAIFRIGIREASIKIQSTFAANVFFNTVFVAVLINTFFVVYFIKIACQPDHIGIETLNFSALASIIVKHPITRAKIAHVNCFASQFFVRAGLLFFTTSGAHAVNKSVILCRNGLLLYGDLTANGTLLALGKTILGAGCSLALEYLFGVSCGNFRLNNLTTFTALDQSANRGAVFFLDLFFPFVCRRKTNLTAVDADAPVFVSVVLHFLARLVSHFGGDHFCLFVSALALVKHFAVGSASRRFENGTLIKFVRDLTAVTLAVFALVPVVEFVVLPFAIFVTVFYNGNDFDLGIGIGFAIIFVVNGVFFSTLFGYGAIENNAGSSYLGSNGSCVVLAIRVFASDGNCCRRVILCPRPISAVLMSNSIREVSSVCICAHGAGVGGVPGLITSRSRYNNIVVVTNGGNHRYFFIAAACASVSDITCRDTSYRSLGDELVVMLKCGNGFDVSISTIRTRVQNNTGLSAGYFLSDRGGIVVFECRLQVNLFGVTATDAVLQSVALLGTSRSYYAAFEIVTVYRASFCGSQSRYRVVREVVCFEGYITVVVGSLNRLYLTITVDKPNCNGVNVLTLGERVRNGDGNVNILTEIGDSLVVGIGYGEVVNRIATDLFKLLGAQTDLFLGFIIKCACSDGNVIFGLVANAIGSLTKVDVGSSNRKLGILKIFDLVCLIFCNDGYLFGRTAFARIFSLAVQYLADNPSMTKRSINRNGFLSRVAAIGAGKSLDTFGGTRSSFCNGCNIFFVLFNGLTYYISTAIRALVMLNINAGLASLGYKLSLYTVDVVCKRGSNLFFVGIAAGRTSILVDLLAFTGCGGNALNIVMSRCFIRFATVGTNLILVAGGSFNVPIVTNNVFVVTLVRIFTICAGISGVTLRDTSGVNRFTCLIVVSGCRKCNSGRFYTTGTITVLFLFAGNSAGGSGLFSVYPLVTENIAVVLFTSIADGLLGTTLDTTRTIFGYGALTAVLTSTGMRVVTIGLPNVVVTQRIAVGKGFCSLTIMAFSARRARVVIFCRTLTGSFLSKVKQGIGILFVAMRMCKRITGGEGILVTLANRTTDAGFVINSCAFLGSSGLQSFVADNLFVVSVRQSRALNFIANRAGFGSSTGCIYPSMCAGINRCSFFFAAFCALMRLLTCHFTSSLFDSLPFVPRMLTSYQFVTSRNCDKTKNDHQ